MKHSDASCDEDETVSVNEDLGLDLEMAWKRVSSLVSNCNTLEQSPENIKKLTHQVSRYDAKSDRD